MPRYAAQMDTFYVDYEADLNYPCFVDFLSDGSIAVSYDSASAVNHCYRGPDTTGHGHFSLTKTNGSGKASLYCVLPKDGSGIVDMVPRKMFGSWSEEGVTGMWRISVGNLVKE